MNPMIRIYSIRPVHLLVVLGFLLTGCGSSSRARYDSPREALEKGTAYYEEGRYDLAALYFQGAFDFGRAHEYAADAQLLLARSYRANKEYLLAANEFTRFTQIYRSDPRVADAEYELAMTYYDRSPGFQFDQTDTDRAIEQFRLFMSRYRSHELVSDAQARILELREKKARKQMSVAEMYERIKRYEAAALSYVRIFDEYYDSALADNALVGAMRNFLDYGKVSIPARQEERYQLVVENYDRLIQIFPDSPAIKEAELIYLEAMQLLGTSQVDS